jgi:Xaa-Pro aminopeptidase
MRKTLLLTVLLALVCPALWALQKEPPEVYRARRAKLLEQLQPQGVVVLYGHITIGEALYGFQQGEEFYYLTGYEDPGAVVLLVPARAASGAEAQGAAAKDVLFLPPRIPSMERYTGKKLGPDDPEARERTGFGTVLPMTAFEKELKSALASFNTVYTIVPRGSGPDDQDLERDRVAKLKALAPAADVRDLTRVISTMRQKKSPGEIALLERAAKASVDAHREAMKAMRPGIYEYELAALMEYTWARQGCERPAYAPIVGSGPNSTILHYSANRRKMQAGDVAVLDVAAECDGYASDITRTLPVSGKFTPRQREIYEVVLGAQKAVIAAIKPGMTLAGPEATSLTKIARDYMNSHGKGPKGEPLATYFTHGLSHGVGLDVHDPTPSGPLEPGMVITVEPGIYIPEESIGVRIEDTVLVTETGARVLTAPLPKEVKELERSMARKK